MEIESVYGFSTDGSGDKLVNLPTLPDSRALTLRVRYSLSQLPQNNSYRPRLADERIGYFITAYRIFLTTTAMSVCALHQSLAFRKDPDAPLSPPKKPIVFWIAVPVEYRDAMKAF